METATTTYLSTMRTSSATTLTNQEQAKQRKKENDLKKCEKEIERLETRNAEIDEEMSAPDVATNVAKLQALSKEQASIQETLEKLYEEWETLAE